MSERQGFTSRNDAKFRGGPPFHIVSFYPAVTSDSESRSMVRKIQPASIQDLERKRIIGKESFS